MKSGKWSIQKIWNDLITEERKSEPREYIRGSEVGKSYLTRYLQMKGVPFTNQFDSRILRVFDCGHIFEEDIMLRMFKLLGLNISTQDEVNIQLPGMLPVKGHHDPRLGGKIDIEKIKQNLNTPDISEWMKNRVLKLAEKLSREYPNGMEDIITEMKTVNSMAFWAHKNIDKNTRFFKGYHHHKLQLWGYLFGKNHEIGRLFYMSKDDLTLMETPVLLGNKKLEKEWKEDIKKMTAIWKKGEEMKKKGHETLIYDEKEKRNVIAPWLNKYLPEQIVWNENKKVWELNWEVGRSNYLTLFTGCKTTEEWERKMKPELKKRNIGVCPSCKEEFALATLNKNKGYCGKCTKKKG